MGSNNGETRNGIEAEAFEAMTEEQQRYRQEQAKGYLQEIRRLCIHVRRLEAEIDEQREIAAGVTGVDYSAERVATSVRRDAVPDAVAKLLDLIDDACAELAECVSSQDEARRCLAELGGVEADVLTLRYLLALSWDEVGKRLGYSTSWVKRKEPDALFCFYDHMPAYRRDPIYSAI